MTLRLNIGAGEQPLPGYLNLDRKTGQEAYPLTVAPESCDEIRASHILEHFPHAQVMNVLFDWVKALKPGGVLKIAVPDFAYIAQAYLAGENIPLQGYVMGGQVDSDDMHHCIFDEEALTETLRSAGLIGISRWSSEIQDAASLPVSLNLMGIKPGGASAGKVAAVMSVPRLGFQDNMFCAMGILPKFGISLAKTTGAFWGQCLTRAMKEAISDGAEWILTIDYDTVFTAENIELLLSLAARHPEADSIVPIQSHRSEATPLMTIKGTDGKPLKSVTADLFSPELTPVSTAHFGLTLIRVKSLLDIPQPWFRGVPGELGDWGDDRIDDDVYFWKEWEKSGKTVFQANRIAVGHLELMIRWPGSDLTATMQHPSDFYKNGAPAEIWR